METAKTIQLSESEESYIEVIYSLIKKHGYARAADIATTLNVKPPSVTSMLQKLDEQKFVTYKKYRGVVLTSKGESLAKTLEKRHQALKRFLIMIGVSEENAEKDACGIEHKINRETMEKLSNFIDYVQTIPKTHPFIKHFRHYDQTSKHPEECEMKDKKGNVRIDP